MNCIHYLKGKRSLTIRDHSPYFSCVYFISHSNLHHTRFSFYIFSYYSQLFFLVYHNPFQSVNKETRFGTSYPLSNSLNFYTISLLQDPSPLLYSFLYITQVLYRSLSPTETNKTQTFPGYLFRFSV